MSQISIAMSEDEALVLFEWLAEYSSNTNEDFAGAAERRVLWDIEAQLEKKLDVILLPAYRTKLAEARARVLGEL